MRIVVAGHKVRGVQCLNALVEKGQQVVGVLAHPPGEVVGSDQDLVARRAQELELPILRPLDVNDPASVSWLQTRSPDLVVLAGYSQILRQACLAVPPRGVINLHGGKLPQYRGSSPLNWALINGETSIALSIVRAAEGIDCGEVVSERTFPIGMHETIADLHRLANRVFPEMLLDVIAQIEAGKVRGRPQDESQAAYYPLRFPDDGLIVWDLLTAEQIHNRIRALTTPYPGAFTVWDGRRMILLQSALTKQVRYGEPGRVYLKNAHGLLVCASDRCLWIRRAIFEDSQQDVYEAVKRYDTFLTLRETALSGILIREPL